LFVLLEDVTARAECANPTNNRKEMLLEDENAVIYGGGGKVGGAVARAFAREEARVFFAGRTLESIEEVAEGIRSAGGVAETAQVDALDERAVEEHADTVAEKTGGIDISFNLISYQDGQGTPLTEMPLQDFERPVTTAVRTQFLTARAAWYMISQGSGVILTFGGAGGRDDELWLKIAKKDSNLETFSFAEALEVAFCYGWIDSQADSFDDQYWLLRFTPRRPRSKWSKRKRAKATKLIEEGRMKPAGLQEVERAKADGRWEAAY